jgi:hypothetical protein
MAATRSTGDTLTDTITSAMGAAAFAASAWHVYSTCRDRAGADLVTALLVTAAAELLVLVVLLELRNHVTPWALGGLAIATGLTTAANLATVDPAKDRPGWGWPETIAVAPVVLFLVVLVVTETGHRRRSARRRARDQVAAQLADVQQQTAALERRREDLVAKDEELHRVAVEVGEREQRIRIREAALDEEVARRVAAAGVSNPGGKQETPPAGSRKTSPAHAVAEAAGRSLRAAQVILRDAAGDDPEKRSAAVARLDELGFRPDGTPKLRAAG